MLVSSHAGPTSTELAADILQTAETAKTT